MTISKKEYRKRWNKDGDCDEITAITSKNDSKYTKNFKQVVDYIEKNKLGRFN